MNRKLVMVIFVAVFLLGLCSCGNRIPETVDAIETVAPQTTAEPSPEPTLLPGIVAIDEPVAVSEEDFEAVIQSEETLVQTENNDSVSIENEQTEDLHTDVPAPNMTSQPEEEESTDTAGIGRVPNSTAFEQYNNMSGDDQQAYMESFDSIESFVAWYNAALAEYEAVSNPIEITDGVIDLGELIGE